MNSAAQLPLTRYGRLMALTLLAIVSISLVASFVLPTLWLNQKYDEHIDDSIDKLQRYRRIAALRPAIAATTAELEKLAGRRYYLQAASANLAAAELQSVATRLVEKNSGRILSSRINPIKDEDTPGTPVKISIDLHLAASIIPLQLTLHALETHVPYLFIEKAAITSRHGRAYKVEPGVQPEFDIQLTISAYLLTSPAHP